MSRIGDENVGLVETEFPSDRRKPIRTSLTGAYAELELSYPEDFDSVARGSLNVNDSFRDPHLAIPEDSYMGATTDDDYPRGHVPPPPGYISVQRTVPNKHPDVGDNYPEDDGREYNREPYSNRHSPPNNESVYSQPMKRKPTQNSETKPYSAKDQLAAIRQYSHGPVDFSSNVLVWLLGSGPVALWICIWFILGILPVAMVIIGVCYFNACVIEEYIPIYLIVSGVLTVMLICLVVSQQWSKYREDQMERFMTPSNAPKGGLKVIPIIIGILCLFLTVWLLAGMVWTYGKYETVTHGDKYSDMYCAAGLFLFSTAAVSLQFAFMVFMVVCVCMIMIYAMVNSNNN